MTASPDSESVASQKALYTRAIDTARWPLLETILPPNFSFKMLDLDGHVMSLDGVQINFSTREAWVTHFREVLKAKQSTHLVGPPETEQISPDEIKAIFAVQFFVSDKGPCPKERMAAAGHYHDTWRKIGDRWLLAEVVLEICYMTLDS